MPAAPAPFPNKWAILIGPTEYQYVKPLKYCAKDVTEVGQRLRDTLDFPATNILEFATGLQYKPERSAIYHQLGALLKSGQIKEDDLLLFYFSGHGIREKKDYLLPVDASPNNLKNTGIEVEDLVDQLTDTKCKNVVMFIDACREAVSGAKGQTAIGEDSRSIAARKGVLSFFSCDPEDLSYEIEDLGHGSFTYCFLEALKSGRCVTAAEVYDYLLREVPLTNQRYHKPPQKPFAIIVPDEKRQLRLLYSASQAVAAAEQFEVLITHLGDFYTDDWPIADKYFVASIELLNIAKQRQLGGDEMKRLALIKRLCDRTLNLLAFAVAWDAIERRGGPVGKATIDKPALKPLS